jgi:hypothetical protein
MLERSSVVAPFDHAKMYGVTPPETLALMLPLEKSQEVCVGVAVGLGRLGTSGTLNVCSAVQVPPALTTMV